MFHLNIIIQTHVILFGCKPVLTYSRSSCMEGKELSKMMSVKYFEELLDHHLYCKD